MQIELQPCAGGGPAVLIVSPFEDDHVQFWRILGERFCYAARTCRQGLAILRKHVIPIVFCERDLPDGTWKDVLEAFEMRCDRPRLIVSSRLADYHLWAEVLNLGGFDVLSRPLNHREVERAIHSAWRDWSRPQFPRGRGADGQLHRRPVNEEVVRHVFQSER